jgi:hypothetical protein
MRQENWNNIQSATWQIVFLRHRHTTEATQLFHVSSFPALYVFTNSNIKNASVRLRQNETYMQSSSMSLCFLKAFTKVKGGAITQQEYMSMLLSHFREVRHREDDIPGSKEPLANFEPWAASLRELALSSDYKPLEGTLFEIHLRPLTTQVE